LEKLLAKNLQFSHYKWLIDEIIGLLFSGYYNHRLFSLFYQEIANDKTTLLVRLLRNLKYNLKIV